MANDDANVATKKDIRMLSTATKRDIRMLKNELLRIFAASEKRTIHEFQIALENTRYDLFGITGNIHSQVKDHAVRIGRLERRTGLTA